MLQSNPTKSQVLNASNISVNYQNQYQRAEHLAKLYIEGQISEDILVQIRLASEDCPNYQEDPFNDFILGVCVNLLRLVNYPLSGISGSNLVYTQQSAYDFYSRMIEQRDPHLLRHAYYFATIFGLEPFKRNTLDQLVVFSSISHQVLAA